MSTFKKALYIVLGVIGVVGIYYCLNYLGNHHGGGAQRHGCCCCSGGSGYGSSSGTNQPGLTRSGRVGTIVMIPSGATPASGTITMTINPGTDFVFFNSVGWTSPQQPFVEIRDPSDPSYLPPPHKNGMFALNNTTGMPKTYTLRVYLYTGADFANVLFNQPAANTLNASYSSGPVIATLIL